LNGGKVIINDVGPRDGLQNQPVTLSPARRLELVMALFNAGMTHIEFGSFVSPGAVPAMTGADAIAAGLPANPDGWFTALIPNMRGYELATRAGVNSVSMVLYGTDGMARSNVGMSRAGAEQVAEDILQRGQEDGVRVNTTIAVSFECPFEGPVAPEIVIEITGRMLDLGADEIAIADTIGAANPQQVKRLMRELVDRHGPDRLACHFHDTRAMGLANVFAALDVGIRKFDASIAGLGGCPFAPGASGNVATEDVVMMLHQMGFQTGVDLPDLMRASRLAQEMTGTAPGGRARAWLDLNT
jgi:hydroxymethylglutaryl-CoA lyase